jgi:pimeloyl-ACP methyl ester carboxylesterase
MASFVLVHGSTHSPRAWDLVKEELEQRGQAVIAPELPADEPEASATRYADVIAAAIPGDDCVVVAHSAAGWFLPIVAAQQRVNWMVFLTAVLPRIGMSFVEQLRAEPDVINPAWLGKDPQVESVANEFLLYDCPPDRLSWAHATIRVVKAQRAMVERYPLEHWPNTPGSYIDCADDRTINPAWSRKIAKSQLAIEPLELPGGHCPYVSRPTELAELLLRINGVEHSMAGKRVGLSSDREITSEPRLVMAIFPNGAKWRAFLRPLTSSLQNLLTPADIVTEGCSHQSSETHLGVGIKH